MYKTKLFKAIRENDHETAESLKSLFYSLGWKNYYHECLKEIALKLEDEYYKKELYNQVGINPLNILAGE